LKPLIDAVVQLGNQEVKFGLEENKASSRQYLEDATTYKTKNPFARRLLEKHSKQSEINSF